MIHLDTPYNQTTFLTAHNAFANHEDGWRWYQQWEDVNAQLEAGVRAFMIDLWRETIDGTEDIYLLHGGRTMEWFFRSFTFRTLDDFLTTLKTFMEKAGNENEIVTVFFETGRPTRESAGITMVKDIMKKYEGIRFDPQVGKGFNSTLQEMIDAGTRLVVFSDFRKEGDTHSEEPLDGFDLPLIWHYCIETVYGNESLDSDQWVLQRAESEDSESREMTLGILNHFPSFNFQQFISMLSGRVTGYFAKVNSAMMLEDHVIDYQKVYRSLPNFISIDMVTTGDGPGTIEEFCRQCRGLSIDTMCIMGSNEAYMHIDDPDPDDNALVYCREGGTKLEFEFFGNFNHCLLRLKHFDLYLSYTAITGAVKLYHRPSYYKLENLGNNVFAIYSLDSGDYMWLSDEEPYISWRGKNEYVSNKWYLEIDGRVPVIPEVIILSRLNNQYMAVKGKAEDNALIYCDGGAAVTFQLIGPQSDCVLRLKDNHDLFLSYRKFTGAVKLYSSPKQANFCISRISSGIYVISSVYHDDLMWLDKESPYITSNATGDELKAQWYLQDPSA